MDNGGIPDDGVFDGLQEARQHEYALLLETWKEIIGKAIVSHPTFKYCRLTWNDQYKIKCRDKKGFEYDEWCPACVVGDAIYRADKYDK